MLEAELTRLQAVVGDEPYPDTQRTPEVFETGP
jgi:hypothetical protein